MPAFSITFLVLGLIAILAVGVAAFLLFFGSRMVAKLIGKYLIRRRIAWVSLVAVMLCTTMVVVVRSVMGGWLNMFRESFHGLSGDIIIEGGTLTGFPHYEEMIRRVEALPEVEAAVPTIYTFGLINIGNITTDGVQVLGYPIEKISRIHDFDDSLYRQRIGLEEEAAKPSTPAVRAELLRKMAQLTPTFGLRTSIRVPLEKLPDGVKLGEEPNGVRYDAAERLLVVQGILGLDERDRLLAASSDPVFQEAVRILYEKSHDELVDYKGLLPEAKTDVTKWPGMIAGVGVLDIKKNRKGETINRDPRLFELPVKLTVMGTQPGSINIDPAEKAERSFWLVDDSRTGVWQFDSKTVYVPFEVLQNMLGMEEKTATDKATGEKVTEPARATDIQVKVRPGVDLLAARERIAAVVAEVKAAHPGVRAFRGDAPKVETWEEDKAAFISAIENETVLMTFLFGIISLVAVFLIFCIFYMIVVEKTKDIGIIKSVGASAGGVAGIFLGYGLAIGLVGGGLGLLMSYLIVTNINLLHSKLADVMGIQIWNPEVYLFDTIPNKLNWGDVGVIGGVMVAASVAGALIPAIVAALKKPVDALRWE